MKNKKIAVALKYYKGELNPFDQAALEVALETGAEVVVVTMAATSVLPQLENLTRLGVKAVLVSDSLYAGSDTLATTYVLAEVFKKINPDLIFCGRQSVDGDTGQVPPMLAKRLNFNIINKVVEVDGRAFITHSGEKFCFENKTVVTFERILSLRFPSIFSKPSEIVVWDNSILNLDVKKCGVFGSPTQVIKTYQSQVGRRYCEYVGANKLLSLIEVSLSKQKSETFVKDNNEKLDEVYCFGGVEQIAKTIAKKVVCCDNFDYNAQKVANFLASQGAKTVLFSDEQEYKTLAAEVAVLTNSGLTADCISLRIENGVFVMTRPARSGDITADIICKSNMAICTVRTVKNNQSDIIFTIGYGAIDKIETIKDLAKRYSAEVCATRKVVDLGKMPYETQVGLTGKSVAPKVYVAFGVSGAVQHTCAISGAGTVIAINKEKDERIFDYADYGIIDDIERLFMEG